MGGCLEVPKLAIDHLVHACMRRSHPSHTCPVWQVPKLAIDHLVQRVVAPLLSRFGPHAPLTLPVKAPLALKVTPPLLLPYLTASLCQSRRRSRYLPYCHTALLPYYLTAGDTRPARRRLARLNEGAGETTATSPLCHTDTAPVSH